MIYTITSGNVVIRQCTSGSVHLAMCSISITVTATAPISRK